MGSRWQPGMGSLVFRIVKIIFWMLVIYAGSAIVVIGVISTLLLNLVAWCILAFTEE